MKRGRKKSQSQIISSILLILLTITAVMIIIGIVIPFIYKQMSKTDCIEMIGEIEISTGYTCFNSDQNEMQVQVHISKVSEDILGFSIELGGPSTTTHQIDGTSITGLKMCDQSTTISLPGDNEERTYVFESISSTPTTVRVYPILADGKICDASDVMETVDECLLESRKCTT